MSAFRCSDCKCHENIFEDSSEMNMNISDMIQLILDSLDSFIWYKINKYYIILLRLRGMFSIFAVQFKLFVHNFASLGLHSCGQNILQCLFELSPGNIESSLEMHSIEC